MLHLRLLKIRLPDYLIPNHIDVDLEIGRFVRRFELRYDHHKVYSLDARYFTDPCYQDKRDLFPIETASELDQLRYNITFQQIHIRDVPVTRREHLDLTNDVIVETIFEYSTQTIGPLVYHLRLCALLSESVGQSHLRCSPLKCTKELACPAHQKLLEPSRLAAYRATGYYN